jgi:hypothetical protein
VCIGIDQKSILFDYQKISGIIPKSTRNVQKKAAQKVNLELSASSQADWFEKNIRS